MNKKVTYSGYYKHESACELFEQGHEIRSDFVDVFKQVRSEHDDVEIGALGCGGCAHTDASIFIGWIAQSDATDYVSVRYDGDDRMEIAEMIIAAAVDIGVIYSWDEDPNSCVMLGIEDYYV